MLTGSKCVHVLRVMWGSSAKAALTSTATSLPMGVLLLAASPATVINTPTAARKIRVTNPIFSFRTAVFFFLGCLSVNTTSSPTYSMS